MNVITTRQQEGMKYKLTKLEDALKSAEAITATIQHDVRRIKNRLGIIGNEENTDIRCREVVKACCSFYGVAYIEFMSQKRDKYIVIARQCAAYYIHTKLMLTSTLTGRYLGFKPKDHATVLHSKKQVQNALDVFDRTEYDPDQVHACLLAIDNHMRELVDIE